MSDIEKEIVKKVGKDESIMPYKILKFRAAAIIDENTDIEAVKDKIAARLAEQIKPYVVFDYGYTNPSSEDEEELCYPIVKGDLLIVKMEREEPHETV